MRLGKPAWKAFASLPTPGWQRSQVSLEESRGTHPSWRSPASRLLCSRVSALPVATVSLHTVCSLRGRPVTLTRTAEVSGGHALSHQWVSGRYGRWGRTGSLLEPRPSPVSCRLSSSFGFFRFASGRSLAALGVTLLCFGIPRQRETRAQEAPCFPLHPLHLACVDSAGLLPCCVVTCARVVARQRR